MGCPGADHPVPPAGHDVARSSWSGHVGIPGQGVEHQDPVAPVGVELAPGLVRHRDPGQVSSPLEVETGSVPEEAGEPTPPRFVPRLPHPRMRCPGHAPLMARNPASRSAMMSSIDSSPTHRRTSSGVTPAVTCSASVSCEWVVEAGWMARLRTSPTLAR